MRKKSRKLEPEEIRRHLRELDALSDQSDEELEKTEGKFDQTERKSDQTESKSDQTERKSDQTERKFDQTERKSDQAERKSDQTERKFDQTERKSDQTYLDEPLNVDTVVHEGSETEPYLHSGMGQVSFYQEALSIRRRASFK